MSEEKKVHTSKKDLSSDPNMSTAENAKVHASKILDCVSSDACTTMFENFETCSEEKIIRNNSNACVGCFADVNMSVSGSSKETLQSDINLVETANTIQENTIVKSESEHPVTESDFLLAIENIQENISRNKEFLDKFCQTRGEIFRRISSKCLRQKSSSESSQKSDEDSGSFPIQKSSENSEIPSPVPFYYVQSCEENLRENSMKFMRQVSGESLSSNSEKHSKLPFEFQNIFEQRKSRAVSSASSISIDTLTDQSSELDNEASRPSTCDTDTETISSAGSSTSVTKASSKEIESKEFFYSSKTRKVRDHYRKLFDFELFHNASNLMLLAYRKTLHIKYISLPFSRFLVEDILDFVHFLNGTEIELREPKSNQDIATSEDRQLAFVREGFEIGVQNLEKKTFVAVLEAFDNYIWKDNTSNCENSNPLEIVTTKHLSFCGIQPNSEKVSTDTESKTSDPFNVLNKSEDISPLESSSLSNLDSMSQPIAVSFIPVQLGSLNNEIEKYVIRCVSDLRMVLDICLESKHQELESNIKNYFSGIKCMLSKLAILRDNCVSLIAKADDELEKVKITNVLRIKFKTAKIFLELLMNLLKLNSDFLRTANI